MSELLKLAKAHQKKQEWKEAVHDFEQYIQENEGDCNDGVYVSCAKCHSRLGETDRAKAVLKKGERLHPKSERILGELYQLYYSLYDKEHALSYAQSLVDLNPEKAGHHFNLGKAYELVNQTEEAKNSYRTGLECKHGLTIKELMKIVQSGFAKNPESVTTEYVFIKGKNNYGSFLHNDQGKKYFTKISRKTKRSNREEVFYRELCEDYQILKEQVPAYIDSKVIDDVLYLTLEMIEGVPTDSEHAKDVIESSRKISSIPYNDIVKNYPIPDSSFQFKNAPNPVVIFFTQIHQKSCNEKLFSSLYQLIHQNHYPSSVNGMIQQLESLIMDHELYTFINPEKHYAFIHGDFNRSNLKVDEKDQTVKAFDWDLFKTGPHFIDIARFLSSALTPYSEVKEVYLNNEETGGKLSLIEKIFFLYALILLYLLTLKEEGLGKQNLHTYISPAIHDLEASVAQFTKTECYETVQALTKKREEDKEKILRLERRVSKLGKKVRKLEKQHKRIINSKTWRITAPIRKLHRAFKK